MTTYSLPSISSSSDAGSLASTLNGMGIPFSMSPSSSGGYNVTSSDSSLGGYLQSSGLTGESSSLPATGSASTWEDALASVYGGADTSNDGAGSGISNNNGDLTPAAQSGGVFDQFKTWLSAEAGNGTAIVVGVLFVAGSVYGMMTK